MFLLFGLKKGMFKAPRLNPIWHITSFADIGRTLDFLVLWIEDAVVPDWRLMILLWMD